MLDAARVDQRQRSGAAPSSTAPRWRRPRPWRVDDQPHRRHRAVTIAARGWARSACPRWWSSAQDDMITPRFYSDELASRVPGAKLVVLDGGGHFAPVAAAGRLQPGRRWLPAFPAASAQRRASMTRLSRRELLAASAAVAVTGIEGIVAARRAPCLRAGHAPAPAAVVALRPRRRRAVRDAGQGVRQAGGRGGRDRADQPERSCRRAPPPRSRAGRRRTSSSSPTTTRISTRRRWST